jgi:hypothetical protein
MEEILKLRNEIPKFFEELNYELYHKYSGQKASLQTSKLYAKYQHLRNKEFILKLKTLTDKSARYLASFLMENYIWSCISKIRDKISTLETKIELEYKGRKINYRSAPNFIANEENREERRKLYYSRIKASYKINRYLIMQWRKFHELSKELGFANYLEYCAYKNLKNYDGLKKQAELFLDRTKSLYADLMKEEFKKIGLDFDDSERHDLAFFFRASKFDELFPKEKMLEIFNNFLEDFKLSLKNYPSIILDLEEREKKTTRAAVFPVDIPNKIYLVVYPKGGQDDYLALFHEAGHAFHFANISKDTLPEFKYLGPSSLTETFAFLFEYLLLQRSFLKRYLVVDEEYLRFQYLYKLYFLRRYCSKLLYEIKLNSEGIERKSGYEYKKIMEANMITKHERASFLSDIDPGLYTAEYLEAWFFESQLRSHLIDKFGEEWFTSENALNYLKKIWSRGFEHIVEEIAKEIGFKGVDSVYVYEEIVKNLSR